MQRGFAPVGRHDKSGLCTMDESSILRRRGLQVGKANVSVAVRGFELQGDFVLNACMHCFVRLFSHQNTVSTLRPFCVNTWQHRVGKRLGSAGAGVLHVRESVGRTVEIFFSRSTEEDN